MDRPVIIYFGKGGQYIENSCLSVVQRRHACEGWPKSNDITRVAMRGETYLVRIELGQAGALTRDLRISA